MRLVVKGARRGADGWRMSGEVLGGPLDGVELRWRQDDAPEDLRNDLRAGKKVTVTVEADTLVDLLEPVQGSVSIVGAPDPDPDSGDGPLERLRRLFDRRLPRWWGGDGPE